MPKLAGDHVQVLVDGYELTGDSNRISINDSRDLFDITAFGDAAHKFSPGQRMMALQHAGFMNSADAGSHPVLQGAAVDGLFSLYLGENAAPTVGDPVFSLLARQGRYGALPRVNQMIPFRAGFTNRGEGGGWGVALASPTDVAGSASGTVVDNGVASKWGGVACLHVLSGADSNAYTIMVEGSGSGAFSGEESTLATFTLNGSAIGSEQIKIAGTIPRFVRWKATIDSAAVDRIRIAVSLIRALGIDLSPRGLLADFQFSGREQRGYMLTYLEPHTGTRWLNLTREDGSNTDIWLGNMFWHSGAGDRDRPQFHGLGQHDWQLLPSLLPYSSFYIYLPDDHQIFECPIAANINASTLSLDFNLAPRPSSFVNGSPIRILVADRGQGQRIKTWIAKGNTSEVITPPAKPQPVSLDPGNESVAVGFTPPAPGGSPITTHVIGYREAGSTHADSTVYNVNSTPHTVTGLTNGTAYEFRIGAINRGGVGQWSDYVSTTPSSS